MITFIWIFLAFWGTDNVRAISGPIPRVQMPGHYMAMKGDIPVAFVLNLNYSYLKNFNPMIHLEYLPGDSVLTNAHTASSAVHLAR